ncbi:beta-1,4-galactosyltransferase 4-like [Plodia interpunctella]|uniref:beta-1,4-galactosyltransferase 4-like n=1 Tax=Plodia interpunctella TaxID=58824 RepID=UPI002368311F|nr:beta-1,4-galactosyltransferase 4-like [Plodia interpunctella]
MIVHLLYMLLAAFTVSVGITNILYTLSCPEAHPLMRRVNVHRRHLNYETQQRRKQQAENLTKKPDLYNNNPVKIMWNLAHKHPSKLGDFLKVLSKTKKQNSQIINSVEDDTHPPITYCPNDHRYLGPTNWKAAAKPKAMDGIFSMLNKGGSYQPLDCVPTETVAVIIPFRGQGGPLPEFLFSLHFLLLVQLVDYQIFVVKNIKETAPFYPGLLANIGFVEAQKIRADLYFTCVIFHDPYLAPRDSSNLYRCSDHPKQLVASIDRVPYKNPLGGVVAIRPKDFRAVNGFSNSYNDSESIYLDIYDRFMAANYTIGAPTPAIATYDSLLRLKPRANTGPAQNTSTTPIPIITETILWDDEGISSLLSMSYLLKITKNKLTHTLIEVEMYPNQILDITLFYENTTLENYGNTTVITFSENSLY